LKRGARLGGDVALLPALITELEAQEVDAIVIHG